MIAPNDQTAIPKADNLPLQSAKMSGMPSEQASSTMRALYARDAFGADRLAQPYPRIRGVERIFDQFGSGQLQQPRNLHDGSLHLGDVRQRRRGKRIARSGLEYEGEFD